MNIRYFVLGMIFGHSFTLLIMSALLFRRIRETRRRLDDYQQELILALEDGLFENIPELAERREDLQKAIRTPLSSSRTEG